MQVARKLELIYLLMQKGKLQAKQLAERFEVSPRTIYRDIDDLSAAGFPIYAQKGRGGGICLLPEFTLERAVLSEQEQQMLLSAVKMLEQLAPGIAMEKLGALFQSQDSAWITMDIEPWEKNIQREFSDLKDAILEKRVVSFDYYSGKGEFTQREAEPLQLEFQHRSWYLSAFCRLRQETRSFKLSRMENLAVREEVFKRQGEAKVKEPQPMQDMEPVRLRIAPAAAYRVRDEFPKEQISTRPDGSLQVETGFPIDNWAVGYVLSYGSDIEVLAPESLRAAVMEALARLQNIYRRGIPE